MWLLFEGDVYFFGKFRDINDSWIRYERARRWRLLDAVSSTHSLSVLPSAVGTTHTTHTIHTQNIHTSVVTIVRNHLHSVYIPFTSHGYYSRAASIRRNTVYLISHHFWRPSYTRLFPYSHTACNKKVLGTRLPRTRFTTAQQETFKGENFRGFVAIRKSFLCEIWGRGILWQHNWQHQWAIRESFLCENLIFHHLWKFSPTNVSRYTLLINWKFFCRCKHTLPPNEALQYLFWASWWRQPLIHSTFLTRPRQSYPDPVSSGIGVWTAQSPTHLWKRRKEKQTWCHYDIIVTLVVHWSNLRCGLLVYGRSHRGGVRYAFTLW